MTIYLAGVFETRARLRPIRDAMRALGHTVTASWLNEPDGATPSLLGSECLDIARRDMAEIGVADRLYVDTLDEAPRGGREFEAGYASCLRVSPTIVIVGPRRNVFHWLFPQYPSWTEALAALKPESTA